MRGLQRVDHMEIMCPGLRPVFPWVGAGIGADEAVLPICRRSARMMRLEARAVVVALVAEQVPERLVPRTALHQPCPIVVADLVAEVSEQGAVGLSHVLPSALALRVVGFGDVDRDQ